MISWIKISLLRAKFYFILFSLLYTLAILQADIYWYYRNLSQADNSLLSVGFITGFASYLCMLFFVQFLVIRNFAHEMGNLETLGMRRWQYLLYYLVQFFVSYLFAWFISLPMFPILQIMVENTSPGFLELLRIYFTSLFVLGGFVLLTVGISLFWHSRQDPFLLLKEKL